MINSQIAIESLEHGREKSTERATDLLFHYITQAHPSLLRDSYTQSDTRAELKECVEAIVDAAAFAVRRSYLSANVPKGEADEDSPPSRIQTLVPICPCPLCGKRAIVPLNAEQLAMQPDKTTHVCHPALGGCNHGFELEPLDWGDPRATVSVQQGARLKDQEVLP